MYQFTEDCRIGIPEIDEEHKKLFQMVNEAFALLAEPSATVVGVKNLVLALKKYAATHFIHEEAYMDEIKDPELPRQKKEHEQFKEKVNEVDLEALNDENGKEVLTELLEFLSRWLYHHILGSDTMIGKMPGKRKMKFANLRAAYGFMLSHKLGVELIDSEHQRLFEIIRETNELTNDVLFNDKYDDIKKIISELKDYTIKHFGDEEEYMEKIGYSGLEAQKVAHQAFVDRLNEVNLEAVDGDQEGYLHELIEFLLGWLANHILKMDKKIPMEG